VAKIRTGFRLEGRCSGKAAGSVTKSDGIRCGTMCQSSNERQNGRKRPELLPSGLDHARVLQQHDRCANRIDRINSRAIVCRLPGFPVLSFRFDKRNPCFKKQWFSMYYADTVYRPWINVESGREQYKKLTLETPLMSLIDQMKAGTASRPKYMALRSDNANGGCAGG